MSENETTDVALVVLFGGPHDGHLASVDTHDETTFVADDGAVYERTDQQQGDYRVYRFDGEGLTTSTLPGLEQENRLHADLAQLADENDDVRASE